MIPFIPKAVSITQVDELLMGKRSTFASPLLSREEGVKSEIRVSRAGIESINESSIIMNGEFS
jgi:hypothetical protein